MIELEYDVASHFFWMVGSPFVEYRLEAFMLQRAIADSLAALDTALNLTIDGLYSHARPLMRHVFENLMIAKVCALAPHTEVLDKWLDGKYIKFTQEILERIQQPSTDEFLRFWRGMSGYTHASSESGQPDLADPDNSAPVNFIFIHMLLESTYHILCSHLVTPSMKYYQAEFAPSDRLTTSRKELRRLFSAGRVPSMAKGARRFIRDFRSTWMVRR